MTMNDPLAAALSKMINAEKIGTKEVMFKPVSGFMKKVLDILNAEGYVGLYETIEDGRGSHLVLNLLGKVNGCGVVKPRFTVSMKTYEKYEKRFLPAKGFGILIVSTSQGLMTHVEAKEKNIGGKLIAYCY